MRVALVTSSYFPHIGGVEEHVRHVASELQRRGHDVTVWTVAREGGAHSRKVDGITVRDLPTPLPSRSVRGVWGFLRHWPRAVWAWGSAARADRPDVLHVQCFGPNGTYGTALAWLTRTPLVISSHGETLMDDHSVFDESELARLSLRSSVRHAAAVTACSGVTLSDLRERFGLATGTVVPNGVELHVEAVPLSLAALPDRFVAGVGRVVWKKGFDLLLEAFASAQLPEDVALVVGGDGPELVRLRDKARVLGLEERLLLPGRLTSGQVASLFASAAVVAVPSRFEAFGIVVLEAWRSGAPLLVTARGGPSEFVVDGRDGLVRDPEDVPAFADALATLLREPELAASLAARGRTRVEDFTWSATVDAYEAVYRGIGLE